MSIIGQGCGIASLALICCAIPGIAGEYSDPAGFSFTYPYGWIAVKKQAKEAGEEKNSPEISDWVKKNKVDLTKVSVVLIRQGKEEFLDTINVVVDNQLIPADDAAVKELLETLPQAYRKIGIPLENLNGHVEKVGPNQAIVMDYEIQFPTVPVPSKQKQVYFPSGSKTYIVTCTSRKDTFANYSQTFDSILASFRLPPRPTKSFDWNLIQVAGIVGGITGGLVVLFKHLIGKRSPSSKPGSQQSDSH